MVKFTLLNSYQYRTWYIYETTSTHMFAHIYSHIYFHVLFFFSVVVSHQCSNILPFICLLVLSCSVFALSFALIWLVLCFHPHDKRKTALATRPYGIFVCHSSAAIEITSAISSCSPLSCFILSFCFTFPDLFFV